VRPFLATYRLQLNAQFRFSDARAIVPYLQRLGVSHLYLSPIWQARSGSLHGYDVVDPTRVSEDLGGETEFVALARAGLGIIVDLVPNHMAVDDDNPFWVDRELRQQFFDIDPVTGFRRRFFDVDDLVGVRVEDPAVFATTHQKAFELLAAGLVDGLRIDHIDGLAAPEVYLDRLLRRGAEHIWVEKILEPDEALRSWPVQGTTGYDFLNDVTALFVDPAAEPALTDLAGDVRPFSEVAREAKLEQANTTFAPEVAELRHTFDVPGTAEALAALPVYRTYIDPDVGLVDRDDRAAVGHLPAEVRAVMASRSAAAKQFVIRFQQTSGAVMAKGVEDTALYRYVRLLALNEVGGDPQRFGLSLGDFHLANVRRAERFPRALLAAQTHDTKRSGDVRARLTALTRIADEWSAAVRDWHALSARLRSGAAPDWTEELFVYQTLIGTWPISSERVATYLTKALREAKRNSGWVEPNEQWEADVIGFAADLALDDEFLRSFEPFARRVALAGERISLGEVALRLSAPGVPDIYQGDELWTYSLVDPDNRRDVDWSRAAVVLNGCLRGEPPTRENVKLFAIVRLLGLRERRRSAFAGTYLALPSSPSTCAFQRGDDAVVAVAVRDAPIDFELPKGDWHDVLHDLGQLYSPAPAAVYERA
jgi:(1->4)-alpha-D-glucan 1-alpha-D-glucosylmutase